MARQGPEESAVITRLYLQHQAPSTRPYLNPQATVFIGQGMYYGIRALGSMGFKGFACLTFSPKFSKIVGLAL